MNRIIKLCISERAPVYLRKIYLHNRSLVYPLCTCKWNGIRRESHWGFCVRCIVVGQKSHRGLSWTMMSLQRDIASLGLSWQPHDVISDSCRWEQYLTLACIHDGVIKLKHFPHYWSFVGGIHRSAVNSTHKGQWRGALMFSLICAWTNGWANNQDTGALRRYSHVIVM